MFISLGYTYKDGEEIIVKGYILHPHNTRETWIVLKDILLVDIYSEPHYRTIEEINIRRVLEHVYNRHLPGLRVPSSYVYYIDRENKAFHLNFHYRRKILFKNQSIKVKNYFLDEINKYNPEHASRIVLANEMIQKLK